MQIVYVQDQEVVRHKGRYYHSKSKHYFERYLAGLMPDEKLKVLSCCLDEHDDSKMTTYQDVTNKRVEFVSFPNFRKLSSYINIYITIKRNVSNADFCYIRTGISGILSGHICRKKKIPYMFIINEDMEANLKTNKRKLVKYGASLVGRLTKHYIKNANYACYVTNEYLQKRYPCKGLVLGCSDIENLQIDENILDAYINRQKDCKNIVLGTAGPVDTALKGHDVVIKAIRMLREKGVFVTYQLVGGGNANRLETIARNEGVLDSVFFLGLKSRDEVLEWMRGLDIYIQPSRSEGLPRSIIEAMANAVPCIASDVGGIPELLPRKFLFHHNGSEAAQIVNMITDINDNQLNDMAQTNFERSKEYKPELLDSRRFDFFSKAISTVRQNKLGENI